MENKIKLLRTQQGLSQEKLAIATSVTRQTINAIEAAKYDPSLALAFSLAKVLETTVDDLFGGNYD
ncbi:transcriptional regulator [Weissella confusa]|uniref:helix-turn-helix transcriptional regulator n=1 Tax=Weissella confusa TaxID=1583 RepID=UPI001081A6A7|nr:helix-turn-helix transcriptional regulator [Weissella confusa]MBA5933851.1 helix-turn-helix transcriptional regulator [Weissella confusa]MBJ7636834.1 helix-turn-helix transcriptional regulator [Weissella confusa]MBS6378603.1 helix-turn-helix transcriptional regulator [Weissella confusa]MCT8396486.1 transcriptional regulator [Weissella confusa]TGE48704.1 transcriptional regulator [Weissella confusa]